MRLAVSQKTSIEPGLLDETFVYYSKTVICTHG